MSKLVLGQDRLFEIPVRSHEQHSGIGATSLQFLCNGDPGKQVSPGSSPSEDVCSWYGHEISWIRWRRRSPVRLVRLATDRARD